jgi:hypothetical protein
VVVKNKIQRQSRRRRRNFGKAASEPTDFTPRRQGAKKIAEIPKRLLATLRLGGLAWDFMPLPWSLNFRFGAGSTTMPRRWCWNGF